MSSVDQLTASIVALALADDAPTEAELDRALTQLDRALPHLSRSDATRIDRALDVAIERLRARCDTVQAELQTVRTRGRAVRSYRDTPAREAAKGQRVNRGI